MQMFERLNQQQQPYIQSGYGAVGRLNTLLGIGGVPRGTYGQSPSNYGYAPTPQGGIDQRIPSPVNQGPTAQGFQGGNISLKQLLAMRAAHGDSEAQRILGSM